MAWWRRDPSLWARTPIHRYARRALRDHEATLRARCFSKSNLKSAQHEDDNDGRPGGMSNLEWMQLQHYRRWRRRFEENPYRALFGASEDMLNGKGLKDWQWVHKAFPKWMIQEMGLSSIKGKEGEASKPEKKSTTLDDKMMFVDEKYPKKVPITKESTTQQQRPMSHQPLYKSSRLDQDLGNSGVESPSDPRRLREHPDPIAPIANNAKHTHSLLETYHEPTEKINSLAENRDEMGHKFLRDSNTAMPFESIPSIPSEKLPFTSSTPSEAEPTSSKTGISNTEAATPEGTFIEEFLAGSSYSHEPSLTDKERKNGEWRQTVLDRRTSPDFVPKPRRKTELPIIDVAAREVSISDPSVSKLKSKSGITVKDDGSVMPEETEPPRVNLDDSKGAIELKNFEGWRVSHGYANTRLNNLPDAPTGDGVFEQVTEPQKIRRDAEVEVKNDEWQSWHSTSTEDAGEGYSKEPDMKPMDKHMSSNVSPHSRRSTSEILNQLPENDMDLLTAEDVRASMGHIKGIQEDKSKARQELNKAFVASQEGFLQLDPMVSSKIVNDQHVRRKERELLQSQEPAKITSQENITSIKPPIKKESPKTEVPQAKEEDSDSQAVSVLETGLDFMSRCLHASGDAITHHFLQDPVQVLAEQNKATSGIHEDDFFKGIIKGIQKGRRAMSQIKTDLELDLPASKPLIEQLAKNEGNIMRGARLFEGNPIDTKASYGAAEPKSRDRVRIMRQALLDLDKEFTKACKVVDNMEGSFKPSEALKRRFRIGADILQKNSTLTRMMIFGMQAHMERPNVNKLEQSRELAHRLLALQDTQLALSMVVARAMQVLGISPRCDEEISAKSPIPIGTTADVSSGSEEVVTKPTDQDVESKKRHHSVAVDAKLEDEISAQKASMQGLSDDGYSRSPKPVTRKSFDEPNPLAHSLFRPFGIQLESLGKEEGIKKTDDETKIMKKNADKALVKEIKNAYEDVYGPITVDHSQIDRVETSSTGSDNVWRKDTDIIQKIASTDGASVKELDSLNKIEILEMDGLEASSGTLVEKSTKTRNENEPATVQLLKEDEISPTISTPTPVLENFDAIVAGRLDGIAANDQIVATKDGKASHEELTASSSLPTVPGNPTKRANMDSTSNINAFENFQDDQVINSEPLYEIYCYDAQSDSIVTSFSQDSTLDKLPSISLHEAIDKLHYPLKFLTHLPPRFEIVTVTPIMLVIRLIPASAFPLKVNTTRTPTNATSTEARDSVWKGINPIDGTTRLSPTGYVGDGLELEREFEERRRAADEYHGRFQGEQGEGRKSRRRKEGGRIGVGSVMKTGIMAGAACYVVGVMAELVK